MTNTPRRATTMAEFGQKHIAQRTAKAVDPAATFRPRPSDVIITPFGKCGTTWLQQIFHTLRTRGDTDYADISAVVPWIEMSARLGQDLDAEQKAEPRGFKSHHDWDQVPKGCRYIVSMRDPKDALVSLFRFMEGWFIEPGTIGITEFAAQAYLAERPGPNYWSHLRSWWAVRNDPAVLMFSYEQMNRDPETAVRRVARHCGIELDDELLRITLAHSSLRYMLANKHQFDDALLRDQLEQSGTLPPGSDSSKVRAGKVGSHRVELDAATIAAMDARWAKEITEPLGFADYAAMEATLVAETGGEVAEG